MHIVKLSFRPGVALFSANGILERSSNFSIILLSNYCRYLKVAGIGTVFRCLWKSLRDPLEPLEFRLMRWEVVDAQRLLGAFSNYSGDM